MKNKEGSKTKSPLPDVPVAGLNFKMNVVSNLTVRKTIEGNLPCRIEDAIRTITTIVVVISGDRGENRHGKMSPRSLRQHFKTYTFQVYVVKAFRKIYLFTYTEIAIQIE